MPNKQVLVCPTCFGRIVNDVQLAGQILQCPHCRGEFQMPGDPHGQDHRGNSDLLEALVRWLWQKSHSRSRVRRKTDEVSQMRFASHRPPVRDKSPMDNQPDAFEAFAHMATDPLKDVAASWDKNAQQMYEKELTRIAAETARRLRNARDPSYMIRNIWIIALVFGLMAWIGIFFGYYIGMVDRPPPIGAFIASAVFSFLWACGVFAGTSIIAYLYCYDQYRQMKADYRERQFAQKEHRNKLLRDEGSASDCPQCRTERSGTLLSRKRVQTDKIGHYKSHERVPITDALGGVTGYIHQPFQQQYHIAVLRRSYQCSRCGCNWDHDEQLRPGF